MKCSAAAFVIVIGWIGTIPASATVVYDNLGPNNVYRDVGAWFGTVPGGSTSTEATAFRPSSSGTLDEVTAALFRASGINEFTEFLRADQSGHPGPTLWQQTFDNQLGPYKSVAVLNIADGPRLDAGTQYWIVVSAPNDGATYHDWYDGVSGTTSDARISAEEVEWTTYHNLVGRGLRVEVTPEPTFAIVAPVTLVFMLHRRRRSAFVLTRDRLE